jgi:hypothetical protein
MSYIVYETNWATELSGRDGTKRPANQFLILRVSMKNASTKKRALPYFTLVGPDGKEYSEVTEGVDHTPEWLGVLRELGPSETATGTAVFDVPQAAYKLVLSDGGPIEEEKTAMVQLPLELVKAPEAPLP